MLSAGDPQPHFKLIGSGTLVEIDNTYHVLTAAHVWHEARGVDQIGLALTTYPSAFAIPCDAIRVKSVWSHENPEWGPDLALLELPRPLVSRIGAHKSFLNLRQQRSTLATHPPALGRCWAVTGMVGQFSEVQSRPQDGIIEANIQARAFFSLIQQTHLREGYDYFDAGAKANLMGVPSSFGGLSGGGLWEIGLSMTKSGAISWDGQRHFRGVAFWQSRLSDGRRMIRCHGPQSVFERAWDSWALTPKGTQTESVDGRQIAREFAVQWQAARAETEAGGAPRVTDDAEPPATWQDKLL